MLPVHCESVKGGGGRGLCFWDPADGYSITILLLHCLEHPLFISAKEERSIENHICSSTIGSESDKSIFDQSPLSRSRLEGEPMDLVVIITDPATVTT